VPIISKMFNSEEPLYIILTIVVLVLLVWGFWEVLSAKRPSEETMPEVTTRQLKGFGLILLSWVVLAVGAGMIVQSEGGFHTLLA